MDLQNCETLKPDKLMAPLRSLVHICQLSESYQMSQVSDTADW